MILNHDLKLNTIVRENGLAGKNNLDAAVADMYVDCTSDLIMSKLEQNMYVNSVSKTPI